MDRITSLFEQLPLSDLSRVVVRRTVLFGIGTGVVAFGVALAVGRPLVGVGACIGLALGLTNIRLVARSVAKINAQNNARPKRALASNTLFRLGASTIIVIGLAVASVQLGLGTAGGIALFYLLLLFSLIRTLLHANTTGAAL